MKDTLRVLSILDDFVSEDDTPLLEARRLARAAHRKTCRLEQAALSALELLHKMRWRNWPKGTTEALGLSCMDEFDEVLIELDKSVNAGRRSTGRKKEPK